MATILRQPGCRGSVAKRSSAPQPPSIPASWRNSYAEAMNSSVNTRNNIAETETNDVSVGGGLSCKACPMPSEQESEKILFFFTGDITQEIHQANLYTK